jgi:hypothetical protein
VTLNPTASVSRLRGAGYYVGIVVLISQIVQTIVSMWPVRVHSATWRIMFVGAIANSLFMILLITFIMAAIAVVAGDRRTTFVIAGLSALVSIVLVGLMGMLTLDVLQMRNLVQQQVAGQYDVATAWALSRQALAVVGFLIMTVTTFRSARGMKTEPVRATKGSHLIVGGVGGPRTEKNPVAPGAAAP